MTRILLVRLGSLGDVVHAIPAAAALRETFPDAAIDWVVDPVYVPLLNLVTCVDAAQPIDLRGYRSATGRHALRTWLGEARRRRYDVGFDLQGLVKSAVVARSVGAARTVGFSRGHVRESLASVLYSETVDPAGAVHVIEKNLALVGLGGARAGAPHFPLHIPPSRAAHDVAKRCGRDGYALLNPGAAWPNKRWPPSRFGAVAATLAAEQGLRSVVLWGPGEEALASEVVAHAQGAAEAAPPTGLSDLVALAHGARVMISGDTGPLHVAAAVGTPTVSLFGPTRPERNGPWNVRDRVVSRVDECQCVYLRQCRVATRCIDGISTADVVTAVVTRLAP